jgi:glycosyltransferase involved in cell wall biosynthesis
MTESDPKQSWTFGIMCYNEVGSLESVVADIRLTAPRFTARYEILIVDDGSTDGSRELALALEARFPEVRCILHPVNMGIGHTLRNIYLNAAMENVANLPGDGQFKSEEYLKIRSLPHGAFVAFYRKENTHYNFFRNGLSLLNSYINRYFIGFVCKDVNWTKVYKSEDIVGLQLQLVSSLVESEICAKLRLLGRQIIEVESAYHQRLHGKAKGARAGVILAAAREVLRLKIEMMRFKYIVRNQKKEAHAF